VTAAMWIMWLIRRFLARESRCRFCSPEEASKGAVPVQDANRFDTAKIRQPRAACQQGSWRGTSLLHAGENGWRVPDFNLDTLQDRNGPIPSAAWSLAFANSQGYERTTARLSFLAAHYVFSSVLKSGYAAQVGSQPSGNAKDDLGSSLDAIAVLEMSLPSEANFGQRPLSLWSWARVLLDSNQPNKGAVWVEGALSSDHLPHAMRPLAALARTALRATSVIRKGLWLHSSSRLTGLAMSLWVSRRAWKPRDG